MKCYAQGHTVLEETITLHDKLITKVMEQSIHPDSCSKLQDASTRLAVAGSESKTEFLLLYWECGSGRHFVYSMQANRKPKPTKK